MTSDLSILRLASAMAQHAALRHRVIAENLAQADTPGFRARDIPAFDPKRALRDARAAAASGQPYGARTARIEPFEVDGLESSPTGNTVEVEQQLTLAADAQAQHQAALSIYRKSMDLLRLSVVGRAR